MATFINLVRKGLTFTTIVGVCLLLFVSCNLEWENTEIDESLFANYLATELIPTLSSSRSAVITHDYSMAWNTNNPYDSSGFKHNEMLDYYVKNRDNSFIITNLSDAIADFYDVVKNFTYLDSSLLQSANEHFFVELQTNYPTLENYINNNSSTILSSKLNGLFDIMRNNGNKTSICSNIKTLENTVIATSNLSDNEKMIFLTASSIAKFSSIYWIEVDEGDGAGNYWGDFLKGDTASISYSVGPITKAAVDVAAGIAYLSEGGWTTPWNAIGIATSASGLFAIAYDGLQAFFREIGWNWPDLP